MSSEIWRKSRALERFGGDEQLLREMCKIFLEESPKLMQNLREALGAADPEGVFYAAHSLSGQLASLEAAPAFKAANQLEGMGRRGDLSEAADVLARLETEMANLHLCLQDCQDPSQ